MSRYSARYRQADLEPNILSFVVVVAITRSTNDLLFPSVNIYFTVINTV